MMVGNRMYHRFGHIPWLCRKMCHMFGHCNDVGKWTMRSQANTFRRKSTFFLMIKLSKGLGSIIWYGKDKDWVFTIPWFGIHRNQCGIHRSRDYIRFPFWQKAVRGDRRHVKTKKTGMQWDWLFRDENGITTKLVRGRQPNTGMVKESLKMKNWCRKVDGQ